MKRVESKNSILREEVKSALEKSRNEHYTIKKAETKACIQHNYERLYTLLAARDTYDSVPLKLAVEPYPKILTETSNKSSAKKDRKPECKLQLQNYSCGVLEESIANTYPNVIITEVKGLPLYTLWTPIRRNFKTPDDPVLRHVSYFGEESDSDDGVNYTDVYENIMVGRKARNVDADKIRLRTMKNVFENHRIGISALIKKVNGSKKYKVIKSTPNERSVAHHTDMFTVDQVLTEFASFFKRKGSISLVKWYLENSYKVGGTGISRIVRVDTNSQADSVGHHRLLAPFSKLWCRLCYVYDCKLHGGKYQPFLNKKRSRVRPAAQPCGPSCYVNSTLDVKPRLNEWNLLENDLCKTALDILGKNYCVLATIIKTKTCAQVYARVQALSLPDEMMIDDSAPSSSDESKGRKVKRAVTKIEINAENHSEYRPCYHPGRSCDMNCPCKKGNRYCEKYCQCDVDCPRRFPGCHCAEKVCSNRGCVCYANYRECDPDVCGCLTCESSTGFHFDRRPCKNMALQRGKAKHTIIGISTVAGWGLFLREHAKKNDFLGEYKGEVITQAEADRRGKVYDKRGISFLFNLNKEYVVDATRKGNKFRFINHSNDPNCFARVMLVNSEHRIGIYAKVDLIPGEELFFDYAYDGEALRFVPREREVLQREMLWERHLTQQRELIQKREHPVERELSQGMELSEEREPSNEEKPILERELSQELQAMEISQEFQVMDSLQENKVFKENELPHEGESLQGNEPTQQAQECELIEPNGMPKLNELIQQNVFIHASGQGKEYESVHYQIAHTQPKEIGQENEFVQIEFRQQGELIEEIDPTEMILFDD